MLWLGVVLALAAAFCLALASALQQRVASTIPDEDSLGTGLITGLVRRPVWLAGFAFDVGGTVLQSVALIPGSVILVQSILVTTLLFALPLSAWLAGRRLERKDGGWALVLAVALATFFLVGNPTQGIDKAPFEDWIVPLAFVAGMSVALVLTASRIRGPNRSTLLAITTGLLFGLSGAIAKPVMDAFDHGLGQAIEPLLTSWETYVFAVAMAAGAFLQQSSYQAGNLESALPAIVVLEPLVAIFLGVAVLDERFRCDGPLEWAILGASIAAITVAAIQLSRSSASFEAQTTARRRQVAG